MGHLGLGTVGLAVPECGVALAVTVSQLSSRAAVSDRCAAARVLPRAPGRLLLPGVVRKLSKRSSAKVALVGPTGCGKSSCLALLQRLYEPQRCTILLDDVPIQEYDVHFLRSRVVIVDQSTVLFSRTIAANLTYGIERDVSERDIVQACKDAQAWEFINEKPDKLLTMLESGGSNLSGGQRQRLAIARVQCCAAPT